jgi:hypothetical protein
MIRHEYTGCITCHTDPSGAGVLRPYGRAQSAVLLSTRYGASPDEEPGPIANFLFGVVPTPEWLLLQGWVRNGYIWNYSNGAQVDARLLQMDADLGAAVEVEKFRASVTLGYNMADIALDSQSAWVTTTSSAGNLVSRVHWAGISFADDSGLARAGRLNLPFGLRNIEHTTWVRNETRTDTNQDQQHGLAVAYTAEHVRGELMGILGNFQIGPDAYRERGYSGFAELAFGSRYAVGLSSLVTHANADVVTQKDTLRQAHGLFARASPFEKLAFLASAAGDTMREGYVGFVQGDFEPVQGVHGILTGEMMSQPVNQAVTQFGVWIGAAWFVFSHVDVRVDAIQRGGSGLPTNRTILAQLHVYL